MKNIRIEFLSDTELLSQVIDLGKQNSATIGFLPQGAFEQAFQNNSIIVALNQGNIVGYLLFRTTNKHLSSPNISIVHLCVEKKFRSRDIPKKLFSELERYAIEENVFAIKLRCREDYKYATELWKKLGFNNVDRKLGKSNKYLLIWQKELKPLPLFFLINKENSKLKVVIDTNILIRLQDFPLDTANQTEKALFEEAKAIQDDWLEEEIEIYVTSELKDEISRKTDQEIQRLRKEFANQFTEIKASENHIQKVFEEIKIHFPDNPNENTISDIRHLCIAIINDVEYYLTQDEPLLKYAKLFNDHFSIKVKRPSQFIISMDQDRREFEYRPKDIKGSEIQQLRLNNNLEMVAETFFCKKCNKKTGYFSKDIFARLSNVEKNKLFVQIKEDEYIGLLCIEELNNAISVPIFRTKKGKLNKTLQRYLLQWLAKFSVENGKTVTTILDPCKHTELEFAAYEIGYQDFNNSLVKINLSGIKLSSVIIQELYELIDLYPELRNLIIDLVKEIQTAIADQDLYKIKILENKLWPAKFLDADFPTYVIPIKPIWAQNLFDEKLAKQTLLKTKTETALSVENVYYRSSRGKIRFPARILWYTTFFEGYYGTKEISVLSTLDSIEVEKPNTLFKKYERLGIYTWSDIVKIVKEDLDQDIMAILFSNSCDLPSSIKLQDYEQILFETENKKAFLQSPQKISNETFRKIIAISEK